MISDQNKKITGITYNILNLPSQITVAGKGAIKYYYDAAGKKLQKRTIDNTGSPSKTTITTYIGGAIYLNDTLQFFGIEEGRVRANADSSGWLYDYFLKDHLGNTRMMITDDYNVSSPILEAYSYYPFGLQQKGIGMEQTTDPLHNKYTYNGKELQKDLGLDQYDYGARFYDAQIGRWEKQDVKSELYFNWSPYTYALNTPTNAIDPDGHLVIFINGMASSSQQANRNYWRTTKSITQGYWANVPTAEGSRQEWLHRTINIHYNFDEQVMQHFDDKKSLYLDGSVGGVDGVFSSSDFYSGDYNSLNPAYRYNAGYAEGENQVEKIIVSLAKSNGVITESIKVVAHSMGGAYAKGFIQAIANYAKKHPDECRGLKITEFDFASFQQNDPANKAVIGTPLKQYDNAGDDVVGDGLYGSEFADEGAQKRVMNHDSGKGHSIFDFWNQISTLSEGTYVFQNGKFIKIK